MNADGSVLAVSFYDGANRVAVYRWTGSSWDVMGSDIILQEQGDGVPASGVERVSLCLDASGVTLAVGAPTGQGTVGGQVYGLGRVYVYSWDGSSWGARGMEILNPTASAPLQGGVRFGFGDYVSLSRDGNRLAVGALDESSGSPVPFVAVYDWSPPVGGEGPSVPGSWVLNTTTAGGRFTNAGWDSFGKAFSDRTGSSVDLSSDGDVVAWGVLGTGGTGVPYVKTLPCPTCGPSTEVFFQEQNDHPSDSRTENPSCVSLSGDGRTLAVSDDSYVSGGDVGIPPKISVYRQTGGSWARLGSDVSSSRGRLNHDGSVLATSEGYVYRWSGSSWSRVGGQLDAGNSSCEVSYDGTVVAYGRQEPEGYVCKVYRCN